MQTSFMHPPFGFALFYLRSVSPAKQYIDRVTRKIIAPVTTGQIYRGAIPFVMIQLVMVALVIAFPQMVMVYKNDAPRIDPAKVETPQSEILPSEAEQKSADENNRDDLMNSFGGNVSTKANDETSATKAAPEINAPLKPKPILLKTKSVPE